MQSTVRRTRGIRKLIAALVTAVLFTALVTLLPQQAHAAGEIQIDLSEVGVTVTSGDGWQYTGGKLFLTSVIGSEKTFHLKGNGSEKTFSVRPQGGWGSAFYGTIILESVNIKTAHAALDFMDGSTATLKLIETNRLKSESHAGININRGTLTIEAYDATPSSLTAIGGGLEANGIGTGEDFGELWEDTFDEKPAVRITGNCTVTTQGTQDGNALGAKTLTMDDGAVLLLNNPDGTGNGLHERTVKNLSNCTIGGGAAGDLAGNYVSSGQRQVAERFSLTPGGTYYFDLGNQGIPGTQAAGLPDNLRWVPFVYAGTVDAYTRDAGGTKVWPASPTSLFVSGQAVTTGVSWGDLDAADLIVGKRVTSWNVPYQLRAPSGGNVTETFLNEWDQLLKKNGLALGGGTDSFWCQDTEGTTATARGGSLPDGRVVAEKSTEYAFRPVLAVDDDILQASALKTVVFSMGADGSLGTGTSLAEATVVYAGTLTLPAVVAENGFVYTGTVQAGNALGWWNGGQFYAAGTEFSALNNNLRFTAGYASDAPVSGGGSSGSPTPLMRSLADEATRTLVQGVNIRSGAVLTVRNMENDSGKGEAQTAIRNAKASGLLMLAYDISISPTPDGPLTVSLFAGREYAGQHVEVLHVTAGGVEKHPATISAQGYAVIQVNSLSPFVLVRGISVPDDIVIAPPKTGGAPSLGTAGLLLAAAAIVFAKRGKGLKSRRD